MKKLASSLFLLALMGSLFAVSAFAGGVGTPVSAPEPATLALMAVGIGGVAVVRKIRNKS